MKFALFRFLAVVCLVALTACSTSNYRELSISIAGAIELPLIGSSDRYWIDSGPLFVSNSDPLITYRAISKQELEFTGSDKPVYEFLKSSFSDPDGIVERSFRDSHEGYEFSTLHRDGLDIYVLSSNDDSKAYISSSSITIAVEVYSEGPESLEIIRTITNSAKLPKGG